MGRSGAVVLMVFAALTLGGIGAASGNAVAWRTVTPAPSGVELTTMLRTALPDTAPAWSGWHDDVRDVHGIERPTARNLPGQQQANYEDGVDRAAFDAARGRLTAAGWHTVTGSADHDGGAFFTAERDGTVMEWEFIPAGIYASPGADSVEVWAWRFTPSRVKVVTVAGWLLGGLLGWWLSRRVLHMAPGPRRGGLLSAMTVAIVVFALSTVGALLFTGHGLLNLAGRSAQPIAVWYAYFPFLLPFGFQVG